MVEVSRGTLTASLAHPRELFRQAVRVAAGALIMVHNHPSNHPSPSRGDIDMTKTVRQALEAVGVVLHDHVIVSRKGHSSLNQMGLL